MTRQVVFARQKVYDGKNSCQFYSRAEGCKVWDLDGKEYIDLLCGYGPNILGYGDQVTNIKVKNKSK